MRLPWPAVLGGTLVVALGAAGLIRGAMPETAAAHGTTPSAAGPIAVTNAYVRAPVPPTDEAAAYFTVYNTTGTADRLLSVQSGAGESAVLHVTEGADMVTAPASGVVIPAHGTLVLQAGQDHVMIEHLIGTIKAGQSVDLELTFQNAGPISVVAPVLGLSQPAPAQPSPSQSSMTMQMPSGAPS